MITSAAPPTFVQSEAGPVWQCEDCGNYCSDDHGTRIIFNKASRFARPAELVLGQARPCICRECQEQPRRHYRRAPSARELPPGDRA